MQSLNKHAAVRLQQRAISRDSLDWLLAYGTWARSNGADVVYLSKKSWRSLERDVGRDEYFKMKERLQIYAIVADDGRIITAGHRFKRIRRP